MYTSDWRENIRILKGYCKWWCYNNGEDYPEEFTETPKLNERILMSISRDMNVRWEIELHYKQYLHSFIEELGRIINRPQSLLTDNPVFGRWYAGGCIIPSKETAIPKVGSPKTDNFEELLTNLIRKILKEEGVINDNERVS